MSCFPVTINGANNVGIACDAHDTEASADQASYGSFEDFSINFDASTQIGISYVGLSRWVTRHIVIVFGTYGATGIACQSGTLASSGGPAQWYNQFYDIFIVGTSTAVTNGAVGWEIGGTANTDEQATTWTIYGGRTNLCQYGVRINGATHITFFNHTTEG